MEAFYQEYKDKGVVVIGVDIKETREEVLQYVQEGGYSWTFVLDTIGEVTANYEVTAIPTSFFIDREGIIQAVHIGAMTKRVMEDEMAKAMQ
jgi:alkyl hydroperoxide reductase subunit AhpC